MKILVDWNLWNNPKLLRLAGLLGRSPAEAVGLLVRLWGFAAEYLPDGNFIELSDTEIAKACDWRGSPFKFATSLRKSGWLDKSQIHEWQAHQGRFIEKIHAERARKKRAYEARSLHGESTENPAETPREKAPPVSGSVSVSRLPLPSPQSEAPEKISAPVNGSVRAHLAGVFRTSVKTPISQDKAEAHVGAAIEIGVKPQLIEEAFMDPKNRGRKIWEILEPLRTAFAPTQNDRVKEILKAWGVGNGTHA